MEPEVRLVQVAYEKILNNILTFTLKPGEVVSDYQISRELGMSRTPVREAIQRLMYESLVVQGQSKAVVADISAADILEITELRTALEQQAIETIVIRSPLSKAGIQKMRELNEELKKAIADRDFEKNFEIEDRFHFMIVASAGNKRLLEAYTRHHLLIVRARWLSLFYPEYAPTIKEHEDIIDSLEKRDLDAAVKALKTHMGSSVKHFSRVFTDPTVREAARFVASIK